MQVYLILYSKADDENPAKMIVGRKRWYNAYWGGVVKTGSSGANYSLVNQAGQYALFGGKYEMADKSEDVTAVRELREETGIDMPYSAVKQIISTPDYSVYAAVMTLGDLRNLSSVINANLSTARSNIDIPVGAELKPPVMDWEFQGQFCIVNVDSAASCLGVTSAIPNSGVLLGSTKVTKTQVEIQTDLAKARPYSQDIDWYANIAIQLPKIIG